MDEMQLFFLSLDEKETNELIKDIDCPPASELSARIKNNLGIEPQEESSDVKAFPLKRILPFAAMFLVVISCALVFLPGKGVLSTSDVHPVSITTTQQPPEDNPLMFAISSGNEDLIEKLLTRPDFISKETLDFALNFSNLLSYKTIHEIAISVREALGTTGLDTLLESALMGDSKKALEELKKRESMLMTPFEKLSFFFAVAFCDSEVVDGFISRGYDINTKDAQGNSIYAIAEKYGNTDTMQYAMSKGITA